MMGSVFCSVPSWSATREYMNSKYQTKKTSTDTHKQSQRRKHTTNWSQPSLFSSAKISLSNPNIRTFAIA